MLEPAVTPVLGDRVRSRLCPGLKLLEGDESLLGSLENYLGAHLLENPEISEKTAQAARFSPRRRNLPGAAAGPGGDAHRQHL
jgi:hypothetical protein